MGFFLLQRTYKCMFTTQNVFAVSGLFREKKKKAVVGKLPESAGSTVILLKSLAVYSPLQFLADLIWRIL